MLLWMLFSLCAGTIVVLMISGTLRTAIGDWTRSWTRDVFFVADRKVGLWRGMVSLAMNWTQTPAFMASGLFAFLGPWHFIAFLGGNVAALIVMGIMAPKIHEANPDGYTTAELMGHVTKSRSVRLLYDISTVGALVVAVAYTITGLQQWIAPQLDIPFWQIWMGLTAFSLMWAMPRGILGVLNFDMSKFVLVALGMFIILLYSLSLGTPAPLAAAATTPVRWDVLWMIGIPFTVSFLGGPLCNPDLSQRVRAVETKSVRLAYIGAAAIFGLVVLHFGMFGMIAQSIGAKPTAQMPAAYLVMDQAAPDWIIPATIAFVFVITATFASQVDGAGTFFATELRQFSRKETSDRSLIRRGRAFMVIPILLGAGIASLNLDLGLLVQNMAVVRGPVVVPVLVCLFHREVARSSMIFWGIVIGFAGSIWLTFGIPATEAFFGTSLGPLGPNARPLGALWAFFVPLLAYLIALLAKGHLRPLEK